MNNNSDKDFTLKKEQFPRFDFVFPQNNKNLSDYLQNTENIDRFKKKIIFPMQEFEKENKYELKRPAGVLIYGAPGCGKSFLAKTFARILGKPYVIVERQNLFCPYTCDISTYANILFKQASDLNATIIIENVDTIIPRRDSMKDTDILYDVSCVLSLIHSCLEYKVFVIATTCRPQDVDTQIGESGYLDELFYVPFPDDETIERTTKYVLGNKPIEQDFDYKPIVEKFRGYTIADIQKVINDAAIECAISLSKLSTESILHALGDTHAPFSQQTREKYERMHERLEKKANNIVNKIGF